MKMFERILKKEPKELRKHLEETSSQHKPITIMTKILEEYMTTRINLKPNKKNQNSYLKNIDCFLIYWKCIKNKGVPFSSQ